MFNQRVTKDNLLDALPGIGVMCGTNPVVGVLLAAITTVVRRVSNQQEHAALRAELADLLNKHNALEGKVGVLLLEMAATSARHQVAELPVLRKHEECLLVMKELSNRTEFGYEHDPHIYWDDLLTLLGLEASEKGFDELEMVLHELRKHDLVSIAKSSGTPRGILSMSPREDFFYRTDTTFQAWNPVTDARTICERYVPQKACSAEQVRQDLGWPHRRVNSALMHLLREGMISESDWCMPRQYIVDALYFTPEARFWIQESESSPAARGAREAGGSRP